MEIHWTTIVETKDLAAALGEPDIVVVDCRFSLADPAAGRVAYRHNHIPGARYAHLDEDLSGQITPGITGRHPLPNPEHFKLLVAAWGISNSTQVVCYDDAAGAIAARLWWVMNWLGHERVAVLNGGWKTWNDAGFPTSNEEPVVTPTSFRVSLNEQLVMTLQSLEGLIYDARMLLIDARDTARFAGETEPLDPVAGHIPGAKSLPFKGNLTEQGLFLDPHSIRNRFISAGLESDDSLVVHYCGSGVTAAHNALAMKYAGLGTPKLYAGSWSEWITDPERPVATGRE